MTNAKGTIQSKILIFLTAFILFACGSSQSDFYFTKQEFLDARKKGIDFKSDGKLRYELKRLVQHIYLKPIGRNTTFDHTNESVTIDIDVDIMAVEKGPRFKSYWGVAKIKGKRVYKHNDMSEYVNNGGGIWEVSSKKAKPYKHDFNQRIHITENICDDECYLAPENDYDTDYLRIVFMEIEGEDGYDISIWDLPDGPENTGRFGGYNSFSALPKVKITMKDGKKEELYGEEEFNGGIKDRLVILHEMKIKGVIDFKDVK